MRFLNWFDRFLIGLTAVFALLTLAGVSAGFMAPQAGSSLLTPSFWDWLRASAAGFAITWAIMLVAVGVNRFAVMERGRRAQKDKLVLLGQLELVFYPVRFPCFDPQKGGVASGIFPRRNFEKLLELRPLFQSLFPQNKELSQLIALISEKDDVAGQKEKNRDIFFQNKKIKLLIESLMRLSEGRA